MARFRATIQGQRGEASRLGSKGTGITARVNGWDVGVDVFGEVEGEDDVFSIYSTAGSNGCSGEKFLIGRVLRNGGKPRFEYNMPDTEPKATPLERRLLEACRVAAHVLGTNYEKQAKERGYGSPAYTRNVDAGIALRQLKEAIDEAESK